MAWRWRRRGKRGASGATDRMLGADLFAIRAWGLGGGCFVPWARSSCCLPLLDFGPRAAA
eukprot:5317625-Alexandrium_andersonii.AAC.1